MNPTTNPTTPPEPQAGATPDLAAIQARCDAATAGPWFFGAESGQCFVYREQDSKEIPGLPDCDIYQDSGETIRNLYFIAHARTDLPALLAALATSRAETEEALKKQPINTSLRLFDLVRYMRSELHQKELVTDEEYAELCMGPMAIDRKNGGSPSPRRLEEYDSLRAQLATLTATLAQREAEAVGLRKEKDAAIHEREACHSLWDQILVLCGFEPSKGYPGIVGIVETVIAARDTALARVRELEAELQAQELNWKQQHRVVFDAQAAVAKDRDGQLDRRLKAEARVKEVEAVMLQLNALVSEWRNRSKESNAMARGAFDTGHDKAASAYAGARSVWSLVADALEHTIAAAARAAGTGEEGAGV